MTAMERMERAINQTFGRFFKSPNIRYYQVKKDGYAYAWTTSRARGGDSKEGFWTLKYRVLANGSWKLVKATRFGHRNVAKRRAYKWYAERRDSLDAKADGNQQ